MYGRQGSDLETSDLRGFGVVQTVNDRAHVTVTSSSTGLHVAFSWNKRPWSRSGLRDFEKVRERNSEEEGFPPLRNFSPITLTTLEKRTL